MSGIVVGIDASTHSMAALNWAMREAAVKNVPLTVITVEIVAASGWGGSQVYGADFELRDKAQKAAEEAVAATAKSLGDAAPASVTVRALLGQPAEQLLEAAKGADQLVLARRGTGGFNRLMLGSVTSQVVHHADCPVTIVPD
ncbi:MAG TPA: universal stress protein [Streptosporangiaceae bacterium]|jgi:nucleotide-binding universal stress UspA family protein